MTMTFRELDEGNVIICDGLAVTKISPIIRNKKYVNAIDSQGNYLYIEDDGVHVFESIEA